MHSQRRMWRVLAFGAEAAFVLGQWWIPVVWAQEHVSREVSPDSSHRQAAPKRDVLRKGFEAPPDSARPRVWWHWMNGNISKEGIRLDLEWMHRVGIAGFQNFDAALETPQVVPKRIPYMTPEWKQAFRYAIQLGDRFGMEMAIAGSPGWSESGGPWVPPAHAMKKYVWSETVIEGGKRFVGKLPQPPDVTGPFQNIEMLPQQNAASATRFYADAAVVAFREPRVVSDQSKPKVTASAEGFDTRMLDDGDLMHAAYLPVSAQSDAWVRFEYPAPQTIRAITYVLTDPSKPQNASPRLSAAVVAVEASDDGSRYREIMKLTAGPSIAHTLAVPATTAKYFRVSFQGTPNMPGGSSGAGTSAGYAIAELVLHPDARMHHLEGKAAFETPNDIYSLATPEVNAEAVVRSADVIDVRRFMKSDGTLDWTAPEGSWCVLRIGYSLLGTTNHPATLEATGLEVDKLDRRYVRDYFEKYLDSYREAVGPKEMGKRGIQYVINDSWEAGSQNWTDKMLEDFSRLRGYDPTHWLPVLAGHVVESSAASDRFLWDFRKTIADLIATEHYGELEEVLHERGMGHYGESHEYWRAFVGDGMEVKKFNEVPMAAMWADTPTNYPPGSGIYRRRSRVGLGGAHLRTESRRG